MLVRACRTFAFLLALAAGVPCGAFAQAIAGAVHDASGAALPDVTVQAESSALIEKVRTSSPMAAASTASRTFGRARTPSPSHVRASVHTCGRESRSRARSRPASTRNSRSARLRKPITVTTATPAVDVRSAGAATTLPADS